MKIKVQCHCGSKFEFEVEPINGRMPVPIACPACGADDTELANAVIAAQSAAPAPAAGGLRISRPAAPHPPEKPAAAPEPAPVRQTPEPRSAKVSAMDELRRTEASYKLFKAAILSAVFLVVVAAGLYAWYQYFAREPKVVLSLALPTNDTGVSQAWIEPGEYHLIGPGQLLVISNDLLTLQDLKERKVIWSAQLPTSSANQTDMPILGESGLYESHLANSAGNDLWIASKGRLFRVEKAGGSIHAIEARGEVQSMSIGADAAVLASGGGGRVDTLTRVQFSSGEQKTEELAKPAPAPPEKALAKSIKSAGVKDVSPDKLRQMGKLLNPTAKMSGNEAEDTGAPAPNPTFLNLSDRNDFLEAGANVVEFRPKLLESKFVDRVAMKQKKNASSILDSANLTADQGMQAAEEMLNENQRNATGGVERMDVSIYEVTLRRHFAGDVPEWKGKVTGIPELTCLKTVDVLSAGTNLYVFDKQNKLLWEAKSAYPLSLRGDAENPPLVETADSLYVADLANVTRFDLKSGSVKWRYNAVGVSQIVFDEKLGLYVISTTASSESITYSQQINLQKKIHTMMQRVDPETGTALWRQEASGDKVYISGKYLYCSRVNLVTVQLELENGPQPHFYTALIEPKTGLPIWTYHRADERGAHVEVADRWVMQRFPGRLVVLNFFSL